MRGYPRRFVVYDTETHSTSTPGQSGASLLTLRLGCAAYTDTSSNMPFTRLTTEFTDAVEFHDWLGSLTKSSDPLWIFAHNHSFDARIVGFFRELALGRYSLDPPVGTKRKGAYKEPLFIVDGPPFLLRLFRPDGQVLLLADTFNWLDVSLAKIGECLTIGKLPMPSPDDPESAWLEYCWRDVIVTEQALVAIWRFGRMVGARDWQPTLASQAFLLWRQRGGAKKITMPEQPRVLELDRQAYYGGRVDCFRTGVIDGPIIQCDVNSMYPSLMRDALFPREVLEHDIRAGLEIDGPPPHPAQTTAEVWLDTPGDAYPVKCSQGTLYVRGKVRTILCGPELRRACESGVVVKHGRWTRYRMAYLFTEWVKEMWAVRMECRARGDQIGDRIAKMMMDSLFGKFGQRTGAWVTLGKDYPQDHYGHGTVVGESDDDNLEWRTIAGVYQRRLRDELAPLAFVPIASFTTAYGRMFMDNVRKKLWPDGVYYQATDSLLIDEGNWGMLKAAGLCKPDALGNFRHEDTYQWAEIRNIHQVERDKNPIRGSLPASATLQSGGTYESTRWDGLWTGISKGRVSSVSIRKILTRLHGTYSRQRVLTNGYCQPWATSNWHLTPEQQQREKLLTHGD